MSTVPEGIVGLSERYDGVCAVFTVHCSQGALFRTDDYVSLMVCYMLLIKSVAPIKISTLKVNKSVYKMP